MELSQSVYEPHPTEMEHPSHVPAVSYDYVPEV